MSPKVSWYIAVEKKELFQHWLTSILHDFFKKTSLYDASQDIFHDISNFIDASFARTGPLLSVSLISSLVASISVASKKLEEIKTGHAWNLYVARTVGNTGVGDVE